MKNILSWSVLAIFLLFVSCRNEEEKVGTTPQQTEAELSANASALAERQRTEAEDAAKKQKESIDSARMTIKRLKPKFDHEVDVFEKVETYNHKNYRNSMNINGIKGWIYINGKDNLLTLSMHSIYVSSKRLFHTSFMVHIGGNTLEAKSVHETYDKLPSGKFYEYVYPEQGMRAKVLQFIADNPTKPVLIRLEGGDIYDFTLSQTHQQAINETVEFYNAISFLKNAGIDPQTI